MLCTSKRLLFTQFYDQSPLQENGYSDVDVDTSSKVKKEDNVNKNIATNSISSNQKSKKKKKKSKELSSRAGGVDSLDTMLEDLSFGVDSSRGQHQPSKKIPGDVNGAGKRCPIHVLQVDPKFLSAENELRRIFGSKVVSSFERSNQAGSSRQSRPGRRVNHFSKRTIIISPSEHWPRWDGSLSMELLENKGGCNYFRQAYFVISFIPSLL